MRIISANIPVMVYSWDMEELTDWGTSTLTYQWDMEA